MEIKKYLQCVELEELHRYVYDNIFIQRIEKESEFLNTKNKEILQKYNELTILYPDFRKYLLNESKKLVQKYSRYK